MALNRYSPQKQLDQLIQLLDDRIADDRKINLRISDKGYNLNCGRTRRSVMIRAANKEHHLAYEFSDGSTSWMQDVICVWPWDNPEVGAHCINKWFAVDDGFLFNVPVNGEIAAHSVSRVEGKQVRGPVKG
jgi:hypothetical protein